MRWLMLEAITMSIHPAMRILYSPTENLRSIRVIPESDFVQSRKKESFTSVESYSSTASTVCSRASEKSFDTSKSVVTNSSDAHGG